jgi:hypothetical protein
MFRNRRRTHEHPKLSSLARRADIFYKFRPPFARSNGLCAVCDKRSNHHVPSPVPTLKCHRRLVPVGCARGLICSAPRNSLPIAMRCGRLQPILHSEQSSCRHTCLVLHRPTRSWTRRLRPAPTTFVCGPHTRTVLKNARCPIRIFKGPRTYDLACRFFKSATIGRGPAPGERPFFKGPVMTDRNMGSWARDPRPSSYFTDAMSSWRPFAGPALRLLPRRADRRTPCATTDRRP